jgi:hypothetical protein
MEAIVLRSQESNQNAVAADRIDERHALGEELVKLMEEMP